MTDAAGPLPLEMLGFPGSDAREAVAALREKRPQEFDPNCPF